MDDKVELDLDFEAYSDEELIRLSIELGKKVQGIEAENLMFESYLARVGPQKEGEKSELQADTEAQLQREKEIGRRDKKKKGEKQKEQDKPIALTLEQKSEIATREVEELRDEIQRKKDEWAKIMDNCKISEVKKAMYEFKRDIVQQAVNPRTGQVVAERVVRYFEDKIRACDAVIEKLRLKNVTLKVHKHKLHLQLKQKEEMGEVLHAIDFDQLQIENKQYLQKIEERNAEMLKLKLTAGTTVQILNQHKKRLSIMSADSEKLAAEIKQREELLRKLRSEQELVASERLKAESRNSKLLQQIETYKAPDVQWLMQVLSYVVAKASQHDLQRKLLGWERKVEIATMQANRFHN